MAIREWVRQRLKKESEAEQARERIVNAIPEIWQALRIAVKEGIDEYRNARKWGRCEINGGESNVFSATFFTDSPSRNTVLRKLVIKLEDGRISATYSGDEVRHEPASMTVAIDEKIEQVTLCDSEPVTIKQAAVTIIEPFLFP